MGGAGFEEEESLFLQAVAATKPVSSKTEQRRFFMLTREVFVVVKKTDCTHYEEIMLRTKSKINFPQQNQGGQAAGRVQAGVDVVADDAPGKHVSEQA